MKTLFNFISSFLLYSLIIIFFSGNLVFVYIYSSHFITIDLLLILNFIVLFSYIIFHIFSKELNITMSSYLVFNYLFFFFVPTLQLHSIESLQDTYARPIMNNTDLIIQGLFSLIVFNIIFFVSYIMLNNNNKIQPEQKTVQYQDSTFYFLTVITIIILITFRDVLISKILKESIQISQPAGLIISRMLFVIPLGTTLYFLLRMRYSPKPVYIFMFIITLLILIIFKNPLTDKRNAFATVYLILIYFSFQNIFKTNFRIFSFLFTSLVFIFPTVAIITHRGSGSSISRRIADYPAQFKYIINNFMTMHYDAFSNILVSIDYMYHHGIRYGMQLVAGLLFFIPRSIWNNKPMSGGLEIGNYLINNYQTGATNLAVPLVAEAIMNFGYLGIIFYPVILAIIVIFIQKLFHSKDILKQFIAVYFSFNMIFLARGDFTNGYAFFIGAVVAIYLIPKFLNTLNNNIKLLALGKK